ncbi:MAG: hypothetical protein JSW05_08480 [Candidatus Thorarchaeota archaeon]|nr:MAG: hypothetical protein JSW05_08480 [Candidatus Thorarchaeota archaeon]
MPGQSSTEVKCVKCKHVYDAEVIDHIDLSEDHDLLKNLRTGKANRVQCPKCRKVEYLNRSIVINFEPENLIVMYDPAARKKAVRENHMREYESVIGFNETLEEIGSETEFKIVTKIEKLKDMISGYVKAHG